MLQVANRIIGQSTPVKCLEVPPDASLEPAFEHACSMLEVLNAGDGVLILTDVYGATPHNLAHAVSRDRPGTMLLSGLNLPMLLRVFNYPEDNLATLLSKAADGGNRGIISDPPQVRGN